MLRELGAPGGHARQASMEARLACMAAAPWTRLARAAAAAPQAHTQLADSAAGGRPAITATTEQGVTGATSRVSRNP